MKSFIITILTAFSLVPALAQKTFHDPNVEARNVTGFNAIEVSGGIDLYLSSGTEAVAVSAKDVKTRDRVKTEVKNGVLKIYYEMKDGLKISIGKSSQIKAYVSYKTLEKLTASGGVTVQMEDLLKTESFALQVSGGSDVKGSIEVQNLKVEQSGGTDISLSGKATNLYVEASGASDFNGYGLVSEFCYAEAHGASDISITVNKEISAEASGASDVNWKGSAIVKQAKASGAGSVSHRS